jgi:hypothetical protein
MKAPTFDWRWLAALTVFLVVLAFVLVAVVT